MFQLFGYDDYYPGGGINDIVGQTDTMEEMVEKIKNDEVFKKRIDTCDHVELYDVVEQKLYKLINDRFEEIEYFWKGKL